MSFFLSPGHGLIARVILNLSHQHGSHFHLKQRPKILRAQQAVLPGILLIHRKPVAGCRLHCVEHSRYMHIPGHLAPVHIDIPVIIRHLQPEYPHISPFETLCQLPVPQQTAHRIPGMLYMKYTVFISFINFQQAVAGADKYFRNRFHPPGRLSQSPGKKIIVRDKFPFLKLLHRNGMTADSRANQSLRQA